MDFQHPGQNSTHPQNVPIFQTSFAAKTTSNDTLIRQSRDFSNLPITIPCENHVAQQYERSSNESKRFLIVHALWALSRRLWVSVCPHCGIWERKYSASYGDPAPFPVSPSILPPPPPPHQRAPIPYISLGTCLLSVCVVGLSRVSLCSCNFIDCSKRCISSLTSL